MTRGFPLKVSAVLPQPRVSKTAILHKPAFCGVSSIEMTHLAPTKPSMVSPSPPHPLNKARSHLHSSSPHLPAGGADPEEHSPRPVNLKSPCRQRRGLSLVGLIFRWFAHAQTPKFRESNFSIGTRGKAEPSGGGSHGVNLQQRHTILEQQRDTRIPPTWLQASLKDASSEESDGFFLGISQESTSLKISFSTRLRYHPRMA